MVFFVGLLVCLFGFIQILKEKKSGSIYAIEELYFCVCVCIYSSHSCSNAGIILGLCILRFC